MEKIEEKSPANIRNSSKHRDSNRIPTLELKSHNPRNFRCVTVRDFVATM